MTYVTERLAVEEQNEHIFKCEWSVFGMCKWSFRINCQYDNHSQRLVHVAMWHIKILCHVYVDFD